MAVATTLTSVKLSFADIVKGSTTPTPPAALKPGMRGEKRCYCQGEVLVMLGHYGWIMTLDDINHADVGMTAGRVYIHKRDVQHGASLAQGDIVSFYLYVDEQGLGAECCQVDQSASRSLCADADEFVPSCDAPPPSWNMSAAEFVPASTTIPSGLSLQATEFVPSCFSVMKADVPEFIPAPAAPNIVLSNAHITAINLAFFSDDDSDDESSIVSSDDFNGDKESNGGDTDSSCYHILESLQQDWALKLSPDLDVAAKHAPWRKLSPVSFADDSTSAGAGSDSEEEPIVHCVVRAPPGLSLPAGWRAPPGLSLPSFVA